MKSAQDFMREIPVLKNSDGITKARQILRDDQFREAYIIDAKKCLLGYIDITDALKVTATKSNVTVEGYIKEASAVHPADPIEAVARTMRKYRTDSAAIVSPKRHVLGGVLLSDLFPVIISRNELSGYVSDCMSKAVVTATPEDTVQNIYTRIMETGFSAFPVIKKKRLVGVISRRDLISSRAVRSALAGHTHKTIADVMKNDVVTTSPHETAQAAARLLVTHDVSRLPVMEGDTLMGIVDRHDVLASL
ncbi:MAG: CBS domain-containing protein [Methanoregula sp.]|jgi:CBS domain-containing protein